MDLLKAELERKRSKVEASKNGGGGRGGKKKKYLTAAQRRELEEEEEEREEEQERRRKKKKKRRRGGDSDDEDREEEDLTTLLTKKYDPAERKRKLEEAEAAAAAGGKKEEKGSTGGAGEAKENQSHGDNGSDSILESLQKLSPKEVTDTLRRFGLPIRLFGEKTITSDGKTDDSARLQRLSAAMKGREAAMLGEAAEDEFLLDSAHRSRNVFLKQDAEHDEEEGAGKSPTKASKKEDGGEKVMTEEELKDKPKRIYKYFKGLIRQWEDDLAKRPDAEKRTAAGRNETKTLKQCKDYIRPLFQQCRRRELAEDLQLHLFKIVTFCEEGEFVKAHDAYIDVAIGRAAWPIGVTMVGIHARSGRAKIESGNVAHVMNSELHRKYLTSVKRLMSYAQKKRTDVDPSKKVVNL